ncbi:endo-beta-N-acetylglucosaminidase H [Olivibacter domesticus]|uniref:Glycosyl hydrolases family 18 n=1 Tax=Olivibacter domesticus TaxID=407022 RepID=A0A1H7XMY8_OLID1|nr:endo-beta-N-acetylglucosaminidase H [Olivibacter domesticus]SEM34588.1 Glycosyl hydrolases family 18 [Olivibacter domesticus]
MNQQLFKTKYYLLFPIFLVAIACQKESTLYSTENQPLALADKTGPKSVVYVEVNNHNLLNAGSYTLSESGKQLFDIAIIFASNINYDAIQGKAVLYHNENVTKVLRNKDSLVKPLQNKGIKVLLSILGNHQGVGIANFTSRATAHDFAQQLADAVNEYGLDGIDFDDEYAKYGENGQPLANDSSFVMLVEELRLLMPSKIISLYDIGPAASQTQWQDKRVGDYINYSWQAYYGNYGAPNIAGLTDKNNLGPAAVWINQQPSSGTSAASLAQRTMDDGYGIFLYYDLPQLNSSSYLSYISTILYGEQTEMTGMPYPWPIQ